MSEHGVCICPECGLQFQDHDKAAFERLCEALYKQPGPPALVQRLIREAGFAPEWETRGVSKGGDPGYNETQARIEAINRIGRPPTQALIIRHESFLDDCSCTMRPGIPIVREIDPGCPYHGDSPR